MTSEELKYAISVMTASSNGACIQMKYKDESEWKSYAGGSGFSWEWGMFDYRVEPAKTLRPWTHEEVPVGAIVRCSGNSQSARVLITTSLEYGCRASWSYKYMLAQMEHSTDGGKTWHPCGVEVEQ